MCAIYSHETAPFNISVVVPAYRSEAILPHMLQELAEVLPQLAQRFEVILVNDDSPDQTWEVICELSRRYSWVHGTNLMRNYGQHNALLCGIRSAQYDVIVTMDDDLQHPPKEIFKLLEKLTEGYDVVYGTPKDEQHTIWRALASQLTKVVLQRAMGAETARNISAFRVFRTELRSAFVNYGAALANIDVLLTWATRRFTAVRVQHAPRHSGDSGYTFRKLVVHAFNMMTGFTTLPLRYATFLGFACSLFGIGVLIFVLVRYLLAGNPVPGFPFLASTIAIFSGVQLLALGIIGEYMARMYSRMMERPTYVIRSTTFDAARSNTVSD